MIPADILVDYSSMEDDSGLCATCNHAFGPHVLMATMFTPEHGGLIFCNIPGCRCQSPWSIEGAPMPYIPDDAEVDHLRRLAQNEDEPEIDWEPDSDIDIWLD